MYNNVLFYLSYINSLVSFQRIIFLNFPKTHKRIILLFLYPPSCIFYALSPTSTSSSSSLSIVSLPIAFEGPRVYSTRPEIRQYKRMYKESNNFLG